MVKTVKITGVLPLANIDIIRKCFSIHHKNLLIICVNHGRLVYIVHHGRLMYIMELRPRIRLFTSGGSSHIIKLEPKIQIESATVLPTLSSLVHIQLCYRNCSFSRPPRLLKKYRKYPLFHLQRITYKVFKNSCSYKIVKHRLSYFLLYHKNLNSLSKIKYKIQVQIKYYILKFSDS